MGHGLTSMEDMRYKHLSWNAHVQHKLASAHEYVHPSAAFLQPWRVIRTTSWTLTCSILVQLELFLHGAPSTAGLGTPAFPTHLSAKRDLVRRLQQRQQQRRSMFRIQALRTTRRTYMALAGAAGAVAVENAGNDEQHGSGDASSQSAVEPSEVAPTVVEQTPQPALLALPEKLSIYPKPTPTLVLLDTPSLLELRIGQVRRELSGYYNGARTQVQGVVDQWIGIEGMVESRIKSFRDPTEPLNPGLLYTGVSALTASILVRSRSLPARFLLPPLSFLGAFVYFLPRTAERVGNWAEELEGRYVPRVGEVRRTSIAHSGMTLAMLREKTKEGRDSLDRGARTVVESIENGTGLKLGDALGWTKESEDKNSNSNEGKKT